MNRYLGQRYFRDSVGRTEWKGSFREQLIYLDRNIFCFEPGEKICTYPLVYIRREGRRAPRPEKWINEPVKERDEEGSHLIKLIQGRLELGEYNRQTESRADNCCQILFSRLVDRFHEMDWALSAAGTSAYQPTCKVHKQFGRLTLRSNHTGITGSCSLTAAMWKYNCTTETVKVSNENLSPLIIASTRCSHGSFGDAFQDTFDG